MWTKTVTTEDMLGIMHKVRTPIVNKTKTTVKKTHKTRASTKKTINRKPAKKTRNPVKKTDKGKSHTKKKPAEKTTSKKIVKTHKGKPATSKQNPTRIKSPKAKSISRQATSKKPRRAPNKTPTTQPRDCFSSPT